MAMAVAETYRRVQQWAERRLPALTRYRRLESLPIELHRRRIYIVPSGFGAAFGVLLLIMLAGALNYANNAALLLTCLLAAACVSSMLVAFRTLDGLRLSAIQAGHAIAGEPLALQLHVEAGVRLRQAIRVELDGQTHAFAIPVHETLAVEVPLPTEHRGWQPLPRIQLWTSWPLGLFRAWSWLYPEMSVLVWPRPEAAGPPPRSPTDDPIHQRLHHGDDLAALRDYRAGDPQRRIAWKASARHEGLLVKDFEQPRPRLEWRLDWRDLRHLDSESRIARLARWLGEAEARGVPSSLWLPGEEIAHGAGPAHYARCMNALAKLP
ncbi:Uncharacterized conserved protein, DUF58 family, contains vWF domain [Dyella marensis]|uniref:Uncharacterized conserved protein, DUF58 family, contains vWF domain n=2 Tax=Rhodanobacteraceae TaxID=1775411 RepID=A0A1I1Y1E5_9GAMM|nr:Uncharacterized conserved protein, DUF58 family, contains vWF domain [Dyella marensis]